MSNLLVCIARTGGAGQALPEEAVHKRSEKMMTQLDRKERRYVDHHKRSILMEVESKAKLQSHLDRAAERSRSTADMHSFRVSDWASRSEEAMKWRRIKAADRLIKSSSSVDAWSLRLGNFDSWHQRVLKDAPREALAERNLWINSRGSNSNEEIERYHRRTLG
mmetsp:Transcript_88816/g.153845  ORF Transcript_88816/g.153845 Transcript_88816/m.153845 type:complete len:164 (-) Transcript_88816:53-544(-)